MTSAHGKFRVCDQQCTKMPSKWHNKLLESDWWFFFTHSIAVHEENAKGFSTLIFQTCEVGVVAIDVVRALKKKGDET